MKLYRFNTQKKAVVILGAGASRGASFVRNKKILPPLDNDFFEQLQRIPTTGRDLPHLQLLRLAREEFGPLLDITMESFFSQIQFLDDFHNALKVDRGSGIKRYRKILNIFSAVMVEVFRQSFCDGVTQKMHGCLSHAALAKTLEGDDSVVSFNYDCLMDLALKRHGNKRWNAKYGYGFEIDHGFNAWQFHVGKGRVAKEHSIRLLKMHGSLNWDRSVGDGIKLRSDPYDTSSKRNSREVIPPVWNKDILRDEYYKTVWREARGRLRECNALVVIGYSVPETDLMSKSLIRVETKKLDYLIIANPSALDRNRFKRMVSTAIRQDTKIIEFDSFEKLAEYMRPAKIVIRKP